MSAEAQLQYEASVRTRQAVIATVAGVLPVLGVFVLLGGPKTSVNEATLGLIIDNKRAARDVVGTALDGIGYLALALSLNYLFAITRARNPDVRPRFIGIVAVVGGVLAGISGVVSAIVGGAKSHEFVTHGSQTYPQANHLLSSPAVIAPQLTDELGLLLVAFGFVLVSLNAMRVGLLPRFMGYLGLFAGALVIFPIVPIPIVAAFWFCALGYMISGRWPSGLPKSWETGRMEALPTGQNMRAQAQRGQTRRPARQVQPDSDGVDAPAPARTRSNTSKRKRKRRS